MLDTTARQRPPLTRAPWVEASTSCAAVQVFLSEVVESLTSCSARRVFALELTWALAFRQTAGFYQSPVAWNRSQGEATDANFVDLGSLDRTPPGEFELKLMWPQQTTACRAANNASFNHWKQTNHPFRSMEVQGYETLNISHEANGWGGLALSTSGYALVDGTPGAVTGNWRYALGTSIPFYDLKLIPPEEQALVVQHGVAWSAQLAPGLPGPSCAETVTELWVRAVNRITLILCFFWMFICFWSCLVFASLCKLFFKKKTSFLVLFLAPTCPANTYVSDHRCVSCPIGTIKPVGDSVHGPDTSCVCPENYHVSAHQCVVCPSGNATSGGDPVGGPDTLCFGPL